MIHIIVLATNLETNMKCQRKETLQIDNTTKDNNIE